MWTQRSWRATREIARIRSKCSVDRDIGPGFLRVASFGCTCVCVSRWHFWSTRYALGRVRKINCSRARARACHRWWNTPKHSESLPSIYRVRQQKLPAEVIRYLPISRTLSKKRSKRNLSYLGCRIGRVRRVRLSDSFRYHRLFFVTFVNFTVVNFNRSNVTRETQK